MELKNRHNTVKKGDLETTYDGVVAACKKHDVKVGVFGYINLDSNESPANQILRKPDEDGITLLKITGDDLFRHYFGDGWQTERQSVIDVFNNSTDLFNNYGLQ